MSDIVRLFVGAFVQWALAAAFTRIAVLDGYGWLFVTVFAGQTIWWVNIQQTTRCGSWPRWLTWSTGASLGAMAGRWLT